MAGPTTESVNEDVKVLRDDLHRVEMSLAESIHRSESSVRQSIEGVKIDVAKLQTEFGLAKWLLGLLLVATLSGIGGGIWWASKINTKVDAIEATLIKIVDQTKPAK